MDYSHISHILHSMIHRAHPSTHPHQSTERPIHSSIHPSMVSKPNRAHPSTHPSIHRIPRQLSKHRLIIPLLVLLRLLVTLCFLLLLANRIRLVSLLLMRLVGCCGRGSHFGSSLASLLAATGAVARLDGRLRRRTRGGRRTVHIGIGLKGNDLCCLLW